MIIVKEFGPHFTMANNKFNIQPNGESALWFSIEDGCHTDLVVKFGDHILKSAQCGNLLSALVPASLIVEPRKVDITIFDIIHPDKRATLSFEIIGHNRKNIKKKFYKAHSLSIIKPNLFIIGAPRSATTSLYWKLFGHPDIYMSKIKEPFFFDRRAHGLLTTAISAEEEYFKLFRYAPFQSKYVGEASVSYLSSPEALKRIHDFNKNAKIIAILRNPIEASVSMFLRTRQGGKYEHAPTFESAWRGSNEQVRPFIVRYPELFKIGYQLETAISIFTNKHLKIVLYDDLINPEKGIYHEILSFLQLPVDSDNILTKGNSADWNDIHSYITNDLLTEMVDYFRPQIDIVAKNTKRNLDHWLKT